MRKKRDICHHLEVDSENGRRRRLAQRLLQTKRTEEEEEAESAGGGEEVEEREREREKRRDLPEWRGSLSRARTGIRKARRESV
jgi:hypothetical protein